MITLPRRDSKRKASMEFGRKEEGLGKRLTL